METQQRSTSFQQMQFRDVAEEGILCKDKEYQKPLLSCLECRKFPCRSITKEHMQRLYDSVFVNKIIDGFKPRRTRMYVFKHSNGDLKLAPKDFNPDKPDFNLLKDVDEVLCINKVLVKQMKLVVKAKEEREQIRETQTRKRGGKQ